MKKLLILAICLCMMLAFAACDNGDGNTPTEKPTTEESETVTKVPEESTSESVTESTTEGEPDNDAPLFPYTLSYNLQADGTYEVTGFVAGKNEFVDLVIPSTYQGKAVTKIADSAFVREGSEPIVGKLIVSEGITHIGNSAFENCTQLNEITLPATLKEIGNRAFAGCVNLRTLSPLVAVESIGELAFYECKNLAAVSLPGTLTSMGIDAFRNCHNLTDLTLAEGIVSIPERGFYECLRLQEVTFPSTLKEIGRSAFYHTALREVVLPEGITVIKENAFYCVYLESITLPSTLTTIEKDAVWSSELKNLVIPAGVTSIAREAFTGGCDNLESLTVPFVGGAPCEESFNKYENQLGYIFGGTSYQEHHEMFFGEKLKTVTVLGGYMIAANAFGECAYIENVRFAEGIAVIWDSAFSGCTGLKTVVLPKTLEKIGRAFASLTEELDAVYYAGTEADWNSITIDTENAGTAKFAASPRYYYSETAPTASGNYWHYVDGVPTVWTLE